MKLSKCNIYILSCDNSKYWRGYLNGLARHGFTIINRSVYDIESDPDYEGSFIGYINTPAGRAKVECDDVDGVWNISSV